MKRKKITTESTEILNVVKKEKHTENIDKKNEKGIATDEHGNTRIKKIFCCFNKNRMRGGKGISVYQCKSVAD